MGGCLSQDAGGELGLDAPATAKVISSAGELHEYNLPARVWNVLQEESSSSASSSSVFLCNSDRLCYEEYIPALRSDDELAKDQIYFVLPKSRLQRKLSASDMAAMAVKASLALQKSNKKEGIRKKRTQITPFLEINYKQEEDPRVEFERDLGNLNNEIRGFKKPAPPPLRKMQRSASSRRLKKAMRSFRIRLSTIQEEGSVRIDVETG